ncbi:MAG: hypothetical protein KDI63_15875, partial [Gammaproteobacteria bacterium]|nr:hypothetical protein [Gammaproteobacteria bacterium]
VNILNSILFFNNNGGAQIAGQVTATYSNIQNEYEGEGNIGLNPIFDDQFGIVSPSPAIDAGSPEMEFWDMVPPGKGDVRNDMGYTGGPNAGHWNNPVCYRDADGDGHGDPNDFAWMVSCSFDYVPDGDDCDDTDPGITPEPGGSCHAPGVCGLIEAAHWLAEDSPVSVSCDLNIAELTIEPGVVVQMSGEYQIVVSGVLRSLGTEVLPVVFRPAEENSAGWKGLYFEDTVAGSEFVWTEIEGATDSGVHLVRSSPSFDSVTFRGNSATYGGAIWANLSDSDLRIINSQFVDNFASTAGGAIYMTGPTEPDAAALEVSNTLFLRNHAGTTSTLQNTAGGAIYVNGNARVYGSTFRENEARAYTIYVSGGRYTRGGALYLAGGHSEVGETLFIGNACRMGAHSQTPDASRAHGGALNVASGELLLSNSLLAENFLTVSRNADYRGSGLYVGGGKASIVNTTMTRNNKHAVYRNGGEVNILNSILFFNNNGGAQIAGQVTATYSDIQNEYEGEGNIFESPIFRETPEETELHLASGSPGIDSGTCLNAPSKDIDGDLRPNGAGCDMGADEYVVQDNSILLTSGLNLFSFSTIVPAEYADCAVLIEALGGSENVISLTRYDPVSGSFQTCDVEGEPFGIETGVGYQIDLLADRSLPVTSDPVCTPTILEPGLNFLGHPAPPDDLTCFGLLDTWGENVVTAIQRYDPTTGRFETCAFVTHGNSIPKPGGIDFQIRSGEGFMLFSMYQGVIPLPGCDE